MITSFREEFSFLSNFHPAVVQFEGMKFSTVEHAYQAAKTLDMVERRKIAMLVTPGQAKRHGKIISIRNDWLLKRYSIMEFLVRQKFCKPTLSVALIDTYPEKLIEGNEWGDVYWGCVWNGTDWHGKNCLGEILMKVRQELLW